MLGPILLFAGTVLMTVGLVFLGGWVSGRDEGTRKPNAARAGRFRADRQWMGLYFLALVVAPLLGGGALIAFGLEKLL
jgi:hypothetical protein